MNTIKSLPSGKEEFKFQAGKIPNTSTAVPEGGKKGTLEFCTDLEDAEGDSGLGDGAAVEKECHRQGQAPERRIWLENLQ